MMKWEPPFPRASTSPHHLQVTLERSLSPSSAIPSQNHKVAVRLGVATQVDVEGFLAGTCAKQEEVYG